MSRTNKTETLLDTIFKQGFTLIAKKLIGKKYGVILRRANRGAPPTAIYAAGDSITEALERVLDKLDDLEQKQEEARRAA